MKAKVIKETPSAYVIEVTSSEENPEPTLIQREGKPVAVLIPYDEYLAFQDWRATHAQPQPYGAFEAEIRAFEQLKPELLKTYPGKAVAIYQGKVLEVGDNKMEVLGKTLEKYGEIHCYVEWVEPETPRRVRVPSAFKPRK